MKSQKTPRSPSCWSLIARYLSLNFGAGNGIRTRDFDLGKVALYH
jgi:hypothetical protein